MFLHMPWALSPFKSYLEIAQRRETLDPLRSPSFRAYNLPLLQSPHIPKNTNRWHPYSRQLRDTNYIENRNFRLKKARTALRLSDLYITREILKVLTLISPNHGNHSKWTLSLKVLLTALEKGITELSPWCLDQDLEITGRSGNHRQLDQISD